MKIGKKIKQLWDAYWILMYAIGFVAAMFLFIAIEVYGFYIIYCLLKGGCE